MILSSLDVCLFLGFSLDPEFSKEYKKINPQVLSLYVQNNSDSLEEITYQGTIYLGKSVKSHIDLAHLRLLEANIYSFLKKLVPNYPYNNQPLILFPFANK